MIDIPDRGRRPSHQEEPVVGDDLFVQPLLLSEEVLEVRFVRRAQSVSFVKLAANRRNDGGIGECTWPRGGSARIKLCRRARRLTSSTIPMLGGSQRASARLSPTAVGALALVQPCARSRTRRSRARAVGRWDRLTLRP